MLIKKCYTQKKDALQRFFYFLRLAPDLRTPQNMVLKLSKY